MKSPTILAAVAALAFSFSVNTAEAQRVADLTRDMPVTSKGAISDNLVQVHRKHKRWKRYSRKHFRKHHRHAYRYYKKRHKHRRHHRHHRYYGHDIYPGFVPLVRRPAHGARIIIHIY